MPPKTLCYTDWIPLYRYCLADNAVRVDRWKILTAIKDKWTSNCTKASE